MTVGARRAAKQQASTQVSAHFCYTDLRASGCKERKMHHKVALTTGEGACWRPAGRGKQVRTQRAPGPRSVAQDCRLPR